MKVKILGNSMGDRLQREKPMKCWAEKMLYS